MSNQLNSFLEILDSLGLDEETKKYCIIIIAFIIILSMLVPLLEKMGFFKLFSMFFSKFFSNPITTEEDIKVLNELINFELLNSDQIKNKPYALQANLLKELALLNNYFKSNLSDIFTLKFLFTREEPKRAKRLYSSKIDKYLEKSGDRYIVKKWVNFWVVYIPLWIWMSIYCFIAYKLLKILFLSKEFQNSEPIALWYYFLIVVAVLGTGWLTSFLLQPWQAKTFTKLKSSNPKLRLQRKDYKK
ncbi:hypothetical protein ACPF64_14150 [Acinetobacter sp. KB005]|jgi:hypothetical protein|uniref:hypothetical protein n=1 Tax=Acinetobacter sp. KB005 TaxID=3416667 RepID=UPI003CECD258